MSFTRTNILSIRTSKRNGKTGEEIYGKYKLFCICGYTGVAKDKYYCPECGQKADIIMEKEGEYEQSAVIQSDYKMTKKTISFHSLVRHYKRHNKTYASLDYNVEEEPFSIEMDFATGKLHGNFFGIDGNFTMDDLRSHQDFVYIHNDKMRNRFYHYYHHHKNFKKFLHKAAQKRGVNSDIFPILIEQSRLYDIFAFLQYPALQYTPWKNFCITDKNRRHLDNLEGLTDFKSICKSLFGHSEKSVRKLSLSQFTHYHLIYFGPFIKDPNLLIPLFEDSKEINYDFSLGFYSHQEHYLIEGLTLLSTIYDEKVWVKQLIKKFFINERQNYHNPIVAVENYISDIGRMKKLISKKKKDYEFKKTRYIEDFHDLLSKDVTRLTHKNKVISYNEHELDYESKDETLEFSLAKDTHELVYTGKAMNICVGSYAEDAFKKKCTILTLKENDKPVVCLELRGDRLIQAKMKQNMKPTPAYKQLIINWANDKEINTYSCYDL
jgi:hypothetical protein